MSANDSLPSVAQMVQESARAGASPLFLAILATDADGRHLARNKVARALRRGDDIADASQRWGHFLSALWSGDAREAWARADGANTVLMESAGAAPEGRARP